MEATQDCFKGLHKITDKIVDCNKDINNNNEEIQNLELGKTTIRSLLTKGTNEEIIAKLKTENEEHEKLRVLLTELQALTAEYINSHVIQSFKISRQRFYNRAIRKTFSYEMHYVRMSCHFYEEVRDISQLKVDSYNKISPDQPKKSIIVDHETEPTEVAKTHNDDS